jgi:uncharacterized protein
VSIYFLDSSALAKRYLAEMGSVWIIGLTDPAAGHRILVAEITLVEVAAALAARHRAPRGISQQARNRAVALLRRHFALEYEATAAAQSTLNAALELTQRHRLRAYDAVQLATALATSNALLAADLPAPIFVTADGDLIAAAIAEGLATDDPHRHP